MPEKLQKSLQSVLQKLTQDRKVRHIVLIGLVPITMLLAVSYLWTNKSPDTISAQGSDPTSSVEISVVGEVNADDPAEVGNSWPGELISLGNVSVQPPREGTIASWKVHIGETVSMGQVLGTLSRPPATPEVIGMLADRSKELAEMQTHKDVARTYTAERIVQLTQLRTELEASAKQKNALLSASDASDGSSSLIESKKMRAQAILRGAVIKTYALMSGNSYLPVSYSGFSLKYQIGAQNFSLRNSFAPIFFAAVSDMNDPGKVPSVSGLAYFEAASRLASASLTDSSALTEADLAMLRDTLSTAHSEFASALGEIKDAELESVSTQKESTEKIAEIASMILELKKDLENSEGEFSAAEAAYRTISASVGSGYAIVSPQSGIVSSIMKRTGEFVGPGVPVATVTGMSSERLVRFRIPNNVRTPGVGTMLTVVRPGFPEVKGSVRLIGIGNALDETGSYMADAKLLDRPDWPVGASIRVMSLDTSDMTRIKISSVWWNQKSEPAVWAVTEVGRIYAKKLTLGRTLGSDIEVYEGLTIGDRYIVTPTPELKEDMLVADIIGPGTAKKGEQTYQEMMKAMGM